MRASAVAAVLAAVIAVALGGGPAYAEGTAGTTFPEGFTVGTDASLGTPVIGFGGAAGEVARTPVILLHGNNDTPYPTTCNGSYGAIQRFGQHLLDHGYAPREVWALGYQGDQCDLLTDETRRAATAHTTIANVPDLRAFVDAVLDFTGATQVDIVGHSLGTTLAREWMRQDNAYGQVRRLVGVDGPNHGIINCSPSPQNYYVTLGFTPNSPVCLEYGAADTPFLTQLNAGDETPGPTEYLTIVNADTSFVYIAKQDGVLAPVPAEDREGRPHDFSLSARLDGASLVEVTGQGAHDGALLAAHTGIINSPEVWGITLDFLRAAAPSQAVPRPGPPSRPAPVPVPRPAPASLPATGADDVLPALAALAVLTAIYRSRRRR